jgi:hypothetical protein
MMITDFGLSKSLDNNENSVVGGMVGYIEPQCFINSTYKRDKASDIYSLGVLLWEITSGKPPFNNMAILDIAREVVQGKREAPIEGSPPAYVTLYQMAWDSEPRKRPTVNQVREGLEILESSNDVDNLDFSKLSINSNLQQQQPPTTIPFGVAESMNPNRSKRATVDNYIKSNNNNNAGQLMSPPNSNEIPAKQNGVPNSVTESNPHKQNSIIESLPFGVASSINPHKSNTANVLRDNYLSTSTAPIPNLNSNNNVTNANYNNSIPIQQQPQVPQVPQAQQSNQYQQNYYSAANPVGLQQNFSQANNQLQSNQFPQNFAQNPANMANIQRNNSISYNRPNLMNQQQGFQGSQPYQPRPQPQSQPQPQPYQPQPQPQLQPQPRPPQQQPSQSPYQPPQQQPQTRPYQMPQQQSQPQQYQPTQPPQSRPYQPQQPQPYQLPQQRPFQPLQQPQPRPFQPPQQPQPRPHQPPQQPQPPYQQPQHHSNQFVPNRPQHNPMAHTLHSFPNVQNQDPMAAQRHTLHNFPNVQNQAPQQHYSNQYRPGMQNRHNTTNQFPPHPPPQRPVSLLNFNYVL